MNNNHRITLNTNKNIIVEFTNERIIPASGVVLQIRCTISMQIRCT